MSEQPKRKICERCGSEFDPADKRDWYCFECVGEILNGIREQRRKD